MPKLRSLRSRAVKGFDADTKPSETYIKPYAEAVGKPWHKLETLRGSWWIAEAILRDHVSPVINRTERSHYLCSSRK